MLGWNAGQVEALDGRLIPPISFHHFASPPSAEKIARSQRGVPAGSRVTVGKTRDRRSIQVIVVIVGQDDRVDGRESVELHAGGNPTSWPEELER